MGMERFYATLKAIKDALAACGGDFSAVTMERLSGKDRDIFDKIASLPDRFKEAMDDDFNTPRAVGYIFDTVRLVNGYMSEKSPVSAEACFVLDTARRVIAEVGGVLELFLDDPDDYFMQDRNREAGKRGLEVHEIERLIEERRAARLGKDWKRADEIRNLLAKKKIILKDTPAGTAWKIE
jgi:cysteinyl-tRNA synthetase